MSEKDKKSKQTPEENAAAEQPVNETPDAAAEAAPETYTVTKEQMQQMEELSKTLADANDKYLRLAAEYDNFRKRSQKEKDGTYLDAQVNTVAAILPVLDNLERAAQAEEASEGVKMILKQFRDILTKAGVAPCGAEGETFDPNLHNAVMHEDGEGKGDTVIAQVLQKGYTMKDRLVRAAMVKTTD